MHKAYLLIGGNLGNRKQHLDTAIEHIGAACGNIVAQSSLYETAAWGLKDQPYFLNQVLVLETNMQPEVLMQQLLSIEATMGRVRTVKLGPRIIDIDILLMDDCIIHTSLLTLPHPQLPNRKFALMPLAEVAPTLLHPAANKTIQQLLKECADELDVRKVSVLETNIEKG